MLQFFLKKKRFFFLLGLFIIALIFFARDIENRKTYTFFDRLFLDVLITPVKISTLCINKAVHIWRGYFYLVDLKKENSFLKGYIENLEMQNQLLREEALENKRLRELLSFKKKFAHTMRPAEIIGRDPSSWFKTIIIDKGSKDGLVRDCGVVTPRGIVGRIIDVTEASAKVLLITDVNSAVDAVVKRNRARGIVEGFGENTCQLSYVLNTEDVLLNDVLVSSGLNSIYPKGVSIGTVSRIVKNKQGFFQFVEIKPLVDFAKLNEVLVVLKEF